MEKDRHEEAMKVLTNIRKGTSQEALDLEFREIRDVIAADRAVGNTSWKLPYESIVAQKIDFGMRYSSFWSSFWYQCHQLVRYPDTILVNVTLNTKLISSSYGPRIYSILGIDDQTSLMIIGISGALSIVYCSIGLYMIDKIGRIKPLVVSAGMLGAALLVNAVQAQYLNPNNEDQLRSMVAMNFVFSLFYTPLGIISWVSPPDIKKHHPHDENSLKNCSYRSIPPKFSPSKFALSETPSLPLPTGPSI